MENPKPKYAISDFELQPYEPISSRPEEDETPLVNYSSKSSTPFNLSDPVSNPLSDPRVSPSRKYCGMSKSAAWTTGVLVVIAIVALVTGLAVGLKPKNHSGHLLEWDPQFTFGDDVCGHDYSIDTTDAVLVHYSFFNATSAGSNQTASPVCGHRLQAKGPASSLTLTVVDRCNDCDPGDLLVGNATYDKLKGGWYAPEVDPDSDAPPPDSRPSVTWHWLHPIPPLPPKQETNNDIKNYTGTLIADGLGTGACGDTIQWLHPGSAMISQDFLNATSTASNLSGSPFCGHMLQAISGKWGRNLNLTVVDHCKNCGPTDLIVDSDDYTNLANSFDAGASVKWHWLLPLPLT